MAKKTYPPKSRVLLREHLDHGLLKQLLDYDPETGLWYESGTGIPVAGWTDQAGYWIISVLNHPVQQHSLAWFYMTGTWPEGTVDHRDRDKNNNAWSNLREATSVEQSANKGFWGSTGYKGVSRASGGRYVAVIKKDGRLLTLGRWKNAVDAAVAFQNEAIRLHGEFAYRDPRLEGLIGAPPLPPRPLGVQRPYQKKRPDKDLPKGITKVKSSVNPYLAKRMVNGISHNLGVFPTVEAAQRRLDEFTAAMLEDA